MTSGSWSGNGDFICSLSGVGEFSHDQLEWSRLFGESWSV